VIREKIKKRRTNCSMWEIPCGAGEDLSLVYPKPPVDFMSAGVFLSEKLFCIMMRKRDRLVVTDGLAGNRIA
jgi:hypothetical protein